MRLIRLLALLAGVALVGCTAGSAPGASSSGAPPPATPSSGRSADPSDSSLAGLPTSLLFRRIIETDAGRVNTLLLLDPVHADPAQMPAVTVPGEIDAFEWSPDGTQILVSVRGGDETVLVVVPVDGSDPVRIAAGVSLAPDHAWSPDGRSIAFSQKSLPVYGPKATPGAAAEPPTAATPSASPATPAEAVVVAAADGSGARTVAGGSRPTWSPDGKRLAFFRPAEAGSGSDVLWALDLGTGTEGRLAGGFSAPGQGVRGGLASWSPDGSSLIALGDGSRCALCLVDVDGGGARPIAMDAVVAAIPPGSTDIDIVGWIDDGHVLALIRGPSSALIRIGIAGGSVSSVLRVDDVIDQVALTPDRMAVAFARLESATSTPSIWTVGMDGSGLRELTRPPVRGGDDRPQWQPAPVAVSWPAFALPEPAPQPSSAAGTVDLTMTGVRVEAVTLPASCGSRGDGVFGIEAAAQGFTVQIGLGPDGSSTHLSVAFEGFAAFTGKGFEAAPPYVVVEPGSTSSAGAFTFTDLPNAIPEGESGTVSGRAAWRCAAS